MDKISWIALVCFVCSALLPVTTLAVNFAAATKSSPGYQFKLFPFYYGADTRTNKDGNPAITDLGLKKYGVFIGNFFQIGDLQLNAIVPVGKVEIGKVKSDDGNTYEGVLVMSRIVFEF